MTNSEQAEHTAHPCNVRRGLRRALVAAAVIGILCAIPAAHSRFDHDHILRLTRSLGALGPIALFLAGVVGPILFVPRAPICFVAGLLYGAGTGSVIGIISGTAGSILHYYLSMGLLARSAQRLTRNRWQRSLSMLQTHTFRTLLLVRLFPLSNASAINMIAGLLRLPFRPYFWATLLGTLPITVIYALWGQTAVEPDLTDLVLSAALLLLLTLIAWLAPHVRTFQH